VDSARHETPDAAGDASGAGLDALRRQVLAASGLFLLLFCIYLWQNVDNQQRRIDDELRYINRLLAEGTRSTLIVQESRLRLLGNHLAGLLDAGQRNEARRVIESFQRLDSGIVGFGLARADGQLVLVSSIADDAPLPNLLDGEATRDSFVDALRSESLVIGRPYFMDALANWVIPMRVALREPGRPLDWVMTTGLNLDGGNTPWRLELPDRVTVAIVRRDGYLQYATRVSDSPLDTEPVRGFYGRQLPENARRQFTPLFDSVPAVLDLQLPKIGGDFRASAIALPEYDLLVVAGLPAAGIRGQILRNLAVPFLFLLVYLAAFFASYRHARRQLQRHQDRLLHMALHDALTGLPNRSLVMDRLEQVIAQSRRRDLGAGLLFVDLDDFKTVNDTHGHRFGDQLLLEVSRTFVDAVRPEDTVARLGGDEFLVVVPQLARPEDAQHVAERILERLRPPLTVLGHSIHVSTSIGIALAPQDSSDPEELMRHADIALYHAKDLGKKRFSFFDEALNERTQRRARVERQLRNALGGGELTLVYQPIVAAAGSRATRGLEALLRWHSPELGAVPPDEFIPIAEDIGLISEIGRFVLEQAVADVSALNLKLNSDLRVTVNLSAMELREGHLPEMVESVLTRHALPPNRLVLELTESAMIVDLDAAIEQLGAARYLGCDIAIDDFGTGYSSLAYLNRLPITALKIDRSFVRDLCDDRQDEALIRAIIAMTRSLGMRVIAEGVETADQAEALATMGCDLLQGYLFSRPLPLRELESQLVL
jgi:diguanylate cyclase (GGDEF)-like protein